MNIKKFLFSAIFYLMNTILCQATTIDIEDEKKRTSSYTNLFAKIMDKDFENRCYTQSYIEYFSNDVFFVLAINFEADKPKSFFVNTNLLHTIDNFYEYTLVRSISLTNPHPQTNYSKESFNAIKKNINQFVKQLKATTMRKIISYDQYTKLMHTFITIDQKIERAKIEFGLDDTRKKNFAKLYQ